MFLHILFWYAVVCYIVHSGIFVFDIGLMLIKRSQALKAQAQTGMDYSRYTEIAGPIAIGLIAFALAPLTTWHAVLHYAAQFWYKSQNKPVKYWI